MSVILKRTSLIYSPEYFTGAVSMINSDFLCLHNMSQTLWSSRVSTQLNPILTSPKHFHLEESKLQGDQTSACARFFNKHVILPHELSFFMYSSILDKHTNEIKFCCSHYFEQYKVTVFKNNSCAPLHNGLF